MGAVQVYLAKLADVADARAHRSLADADLERLDAITHPSRRRAFVAGRALARHAIERSTGIPPRRQRLRSLPGGRPVCIGGPAISISHSQDWVACAVASRGEIGVDLQFAAERVAVYEIAAWCFTRREREWIDEGGRARFFMLWALKEAHLKATGSGLFGGLGRLDCRIDPPVIEAAFRAGPETCLALYSFGSAFLALATSVSPDRAIAVSVRGGMDDDHGHAVRFLGATAPRWFEAPCPNATRVRPPTAALPARRFDPCR